jgi:hypothetical protein
VLLKVSVLVASLFGADFDVGILRAAFLVNLWFRVSLVVGQHILLVASHRSLALVLVSERDAEHR